LSFRSLVGSHKLNNGTHPTPGLDHCQHQLTTFIRIFLFHHAGAATTTNIPIHSTIISPYIIVGSIININVVVVAVAVNDYYFSKNW
jgi:hypothetical protein